MEGRKLTRNESLAIIPHLDTICETASGICGYTKGRISTTTDMDNAMSKIVDEVGKIYQVYSFRVVDEDDEQKEIEVIL